MAEIAQFKDAGEVIERWIVSALQGQWPQEDDLSVLVRASLHTPSPGSPLTAQIVLFALRPDQAPLYIQTVTDVVTRAGVVAVGQEGMRAIRDAVAQEQLAAAAPTPEVRPAFVPQTDAPVNG